MNKFKVLEKIKVLYEKKVNIISYLSKDNPNNKNSVEDILISYDFQAGSYVDLYYENPEFKNKWGQKIADIINDLGKIETVLEVGVGEGTTLGPTFNYLKNKNVRVYGFDISWSRVKIASDFLLNYSIENISLFVGDLFNIPLNDNSIDVVYTSHSLEPNGGREREALKELYRVTKKYLVLLEPIYEFGNQEAKERMDNHGYIKNMYTTVKDLGYEIVEYKKFELCSNPLNPTGLIIIEKKSMKNNSDELCCPITKTKLEKIDGAYYSKKSLLAYPILASIPCLLKDNAILATKYGKTYKT